MKKYGRLSLFSQETWEKLNDDLTSAFFRSSNHRGADGLKQVLEKMNRQAVLMDSSFAHEKKLYKCSKCRQSGHRANKCASHL